MKIPAPAGNSREFPSPVDSKARAGDKPPNRNFLEGTTSPGVAGDAVLIEYAPFIEGFVNALAAGIMTGALFGLMCAGVGLIYGVMGVVNFAQGEFMMLGMYAALFLTNFFLQSALGPIFGPFVAALLAGPVIFCLGWITHVGLLRLVTGIRGATQEAAGHYAQLILTLGLSLILANGGLIVFGSTPAAVRTPLTTKAFQFELMGDGDVTLFLNQDRVVVTVIAVLLAALLWVFVHSTRTGRAMRAAAYNPDAATYVGIDVDRQHRMAFSIGVAATAIAGGLLATYLSFQPYVGAEFVIVMYAGVVLGGVGSILGAFWGGMVIGLVQQMSGLFLDLQLQSTAIFVVFLLVLLFRPQGLFGRSAERT